VLDTNVLLDLWLFDDPSVLSLRAGIEAGRLQPLRSADCDAEFEEVIGRQAFGLDPASRRSVLARWMECSKPIATVMQAPLACTDPDDQKFLDAAYSAGADWLLTRDKSLLKLARRAQAAGLRIGRPAAGMTYDRSRN
jgi:predicted nucleic acid-binding protein